MTDTPETATFETDTLPPEIEAENAALDEDEEEKGTDDNPDNPVDAD